MNYYMYVHVYYMALYFNSLFFLPLLCAEGCILIILGFPAAGKE